MKRIPIFLILVFLLSATASAMDFQAPAAPERVAELVPEEADSFAEGLWNVLKAAIGEVDGAFHDSMVICLSVTATVMLCSIAQDISAQRGQNAVQICAIVVIGEVFLKSSTNLLRLGIDTALELRDYGQLLLPVMTAAMAAQGGVSSSAAMYGGTLFFDSILGTLLTKIMTPMIYLFIAMSMAAGLFHQELLGKIRDLIKWLMSWSLKLVLYALTGFLTITGVISGTADATAIRAAKIAISGAVPVVGGILSDASETVLISAASLGGAAGVYGIVTVLALFSGPFVRIGLHYLLFKGAGAVCATFGKETGAELVMDFSSAVGMILAMVSTQTVLLLISTMCLMKGVG